MINPDIFNQFQRWSGQVPSGYLVDFIGGRASLKYVAGRPSLFGGSTIPRDEEYFEWAALLEAVLAAEGQFTMIEAGAGYGRWSVRAACAVKQRHPGLPLRFIAIEPEPSHFEWLRENLLANGLSENEFTLIRAAINTTGEPATFTVGHPDEWYGQAAVPPGTNFGNWPRATIQTVPAVTLNNILEKVDNVDLLDMDIQDAEADCIPDSIDAITKKVTRIFIGTHSERARSNVTASLKANGWKSKASYPSAGESMTEIGPINFIDGVEYWHNPKKKLRWSPWRLFRKMQ